MQQTKTIPPTRTIRLAVAEDHTILREGICQLLSAHSPEIAVVLEASNGRELIDNIAGADPDIVLMDVNMPVMNGIEATRELKRHCQGCRVLILTGYEDDLLFRMAHEAGAEGYILKGANRKELVGAIRQVMDAGAYVSERFAAAARGDHADGAASLTKREREVLQLVAAGLTSREIGEKLFISAKTVEKHRSNIMHKLDVGSLAALVAWAKEMAFLL